MANDTLSTNSTVVNSQTQRREKRRAATAHVDLELDGTSAIAEGFRILRTALVAFAEGPASSQQSRFIAGPALGGLEVLERSLRHFSILPKTQVGR